MSVVAEEEEEIKGEVQKVKEDRLRKAVEVMRVLWLGVISETK